MFTPRLALASLSGRSDAAWAMDGLPHVGAAFLGGIALDGPTRAAARAMVARDRTEFIPGNPLAFIDDQLGSLRPTAMTGGINVRSASPEPLPAVASICARHGAILEINAHCRQAEMCDVGSGETLLAEPDRLQAHVAAAACTDAPVSVKVRAEVSGVDLVETARVIERAGASIVHVDAMDSEPIVASIADAVDLFVIANNGVRDAASTTEYIEYGADAVSVGRASDDPDRLAVIREAVDRRGSPT